MKKVAFAFAAFALVAFAAPVATSPAQAETIIIKKGAHHDRGHHNGWRKARAHKVVVVKQRRHHRHWN